MSWTERLGFGDLIAQHLTDSLLPAESHLTRRLFGSMVRRMEALPASTG